MDNFDTIKEFLNYLKKNVSLNEKDFAEECLEKEFYKLIPVVEEKYPLPSNLYDETFDIMDNNTTNIHIVQALTHSKTVPFSIQTKIINALWRDDIKELVETSRYHDVLSNVFKNFEVSPLMIKKLFEKDPLICIADLCHHKPTKENPTPYPHLVSDTICELYIDQLNSMSHSELETLNIDMPFACVCKPETIKYILDNMPEHTGITETIVSCLINSVSLTDEQKNELFDQYGYDTTENLNNLTPYISNNLYKSAIQTLENVDEDKEKFIYEKVVFFLNRAISNNVLTEAAQMDFINRITSNKKMRFYYVENFLTRLAEYTDSPKVLHHILKTRDDHLRHKIIRNKNVSKEVLQESIRVIVNKITEMKLNQIPKFLEEDITYLSKQITFTDSQYDILLNAKLYDSLLQSSKTPNKYIVQIIKELKKIPDEMQHIFEATQLAEATLHSELLSNNYCSQKQLEFATAYFSLSKMWYERNQPIEIARLSLTVDDITLFDDKEFCTTLYKCIKNSVRKLNWKPDSGNRKEFLSNIKNHLINKEINEYKRLNFYQLLFEVKENARAFCYKANEKDGALFHLKKYAERHCEIMKFMSQIPTPQHLENLLDYQETIEHSPFFFNER